MSTHVAFHWFKVWGLGVAGEFGSVADESGKPFMHENYDGQMEEYIPVLSRRAHVHCKVFAGPLLINLSATLWRLKP